MKLSGRGVVPSLAVLLLLVVAPLDAAEPELRNLNLRGLQVGGTTTLTIDGDELGKAPRLLLPFPAKQELKKGTDKQATFDVTLGGDVAPGYYHLRLATDQGVSLPVVVTVDRLPQKVLAAVVETLPVALHGSLTGSTTVEAKFAGKAGQKVLVEIEAQRLGSKLRPVVHLYSARRLQLAWAWSASTLFGDARLEAVLPADGEYIITVHDTEYAGPAPGFFRLKVGQWSAVDRVFPPVVSQGQPRALELLGPSTPVRLDLPAPPLVGPHLLSWPKDGIWSGPRPFVLVSGHPELVGQPVANKAQELPAGPVGVSGRLLTAFAEDRYRVPVTPGTKVRLEVFAERHGSPLDAALVVRNDKGDVLARAEDSPGTLDPILEYAVPANVTAIVVGVGDAQGRTGPGAVYRLVIEPQPALGAKGDFKIITSAQRLTVPAGGQGVVPVQVERRGYPGAIELSAVGLPSALKLAGATIPEGADGALVTIQRSESPFEPAVISWKGRATDGAERTAFVKGHPLERLQPWLAQEFALAPTVAKAAEFAIDWRGMPPEAGIVLTKKLALPVKVTRPADNTFVKLTLLTSQNVPLVNNQPDPNKTLRQEKPIELPAKATDGEVVVLVPVDLSSPVYDVTVQAELLGPDKKTVKAVAYAPVRRMTVRLPLALKLDGPARIEALVDAKKETTIKLQGKVERLEGLKGDVDLVLAGLPAGAKVSPVKVKADATDFTFSIALPPNLPPGEIAGLKLSASAVANPATPNVRVRSRDVELTLVVKVAK